jgi:hypothetical protein
VSRKWNGWSVLYLCVVAAVVGACLTMALKAADLTNAGNFVIDFAKSPGMAAVVGLIAAILAYSGINRQVVATKAKSDGDAWWNMFEWATSQAAPDRSVGGALPLDVAISAFDQLAKDATSDVQKTACAGMIDFIVKTRGVQEGQSAGPMDAPTTAPHAALQTTSLGAAGTDPATQAQAEPERSSLGLVEPDVELEESSVEAALGGASTLNLVRTYAKKHAGTPAVSPFTNGWLYERLVTATLSSLVGPELRIRVWKNAAHDSPIDAIAEVNGQRVVIVIVWGESAASVRQKLRRYVLVVRARRQDPILFIQPFRLDMPLDFSLHNRAVVSNFRDESDRLKLINSLRTAASLSLST